MFPHTTRRRFLQTAAASGAVFGLGDVSFLGRLPAVSAAEANLDPNKVRFGPDIEPLVNLLETSPRNKLLETVAEQIHQGTSYREILAALLLAGVRNVQPRPSVGYKFHAVLVVNSAHLASLASPPGDRWLPIFWALDYYKAKQIEEEQNSGWKLQPVDEERVPAARKAKQAFIEAMETWNEPAADAAVAALARTAGSHEVFELFCRFGARDFRSIGHKAIFVANSWRTLQCIGWHHAEPVLRSLAFALLNHTGDPDPHKSDLEADRPGRRNQELAATIRPDWLEGRIDEGASREFVAALREASWQDCCDQAVALLNKGVSPQSVWDAVFTAAGELLMRQPGIVPLHSLTSANALHYAFQTTANDQTRRLLLLQNCAFLTMFREAAKGRGRLRDVRFDDVKPIEPEHSSPSAAIEEIFADVSGNRDRAAGKIVAFLKGGGRAEDLIHAARRLVFLKGNDAHDYKFSSAVLEDYYHASGSWRDLFLALSVFNLPGSGDRDNQLVQRARAALS